MDWFKKHTESFMVIGVLASIMFWFHINVGKRFNKIETDLAVIKTVLIMKDIMPKTLATTTENQSNDN